LAKISPEEYPTKFFFQNFENTKYGHRKTNQTIKINFIQFQVVLLFLMNYKLKKGRNFASGQQATRTEYHHKVEVSRLKGKKVKLRKTLCDIRRSDGLFFSDKKF
jgi:hypothetical protein